MGVASMRVYGVFVSGFVIPVVLTMVAGVVVGRVTKLQHTARVEGQLWRVVPQKNSAGSVAVAA